MTRKQYLQEYANYLTVFIFQLENDLDINLENNYTEIIRDVKLRFGVV